MALDLEHVASPARPREIGEWVQLVARQALGARAASMSEIEGAPLVDGELQGVSPDTPASPVNASQITAPSKPKLAPDPADPEGSQVDALMEWKPPRHDLGRWFISGAAGIVLLGVAAGYASFRAALQLRPQTVTTLPATRATAASLSAPVSAAPAPPPLPAPSLAPLPDSPPSPPPVAVEPPATSAAPKAYAPVWTRRSPPQQKGCDPPYMIDSDGVRVLKRWCF
jgi:hypothetical protein